MYDKILNLLHDTLWRLDPNIEKKIEAFEMDIYRRMLRIRGVQRVTNNGVRNMMKYMEQTEWKMLYLGHIIRRDMRDSD